MKASTFLPGAMTPAAPSSLVNEQSRRSHGAQTRVQPSRTVEGTRTIVRALGMAIVAALIAATLVLFVFARWHASEGPHDNEWDASSGCPVSQCG
jgi:hypothetical protein